MSDRTAFDSIELSPVLVAVQHAVSREALALGDRVQLVEHIDHFTDSLVLTLKSWIWSQKVQEQEVTYPATWWDHFKRDGLRWLPAWARKRIRVRMHLTRMASWEGYPEFKAPPQCGKSVRILQMTHEPDYMSSVPPPFPGGPRG
jgi:hypothetical protein